MNNFELLYVLFWFNVSILGLIGMYFEREIVEICKLMSNKPK